jgi:hypothetical protein
LVFGTPGRTGRAWPDAGGLGPGVLFVAVPERARAA